MAAKKLKTAPLERAAAGSSPARRIASSKQKPATKKKPAERAPAEKASTKVSKQAAKAPKKKARTVSKAGSSARPAKKPAPQSAARSTAAADAAPATELAAGSKAPPFELPDQNGGVVSSAELAGQAYVLYFYPKDDTPGCTTQACAFRDARSDFEAAGVRVIGVSPDSSQSHKKFEGKYTLPFTLLSDPEHVLSNAYGVWAMKKNYGREYMGVVRSTFLVAPDGSLGKAWRGVRVAGHVDQVLDAARELS